ncbi:MAG TPA: TonB-dependent receptor [Steroidobacteraceae bacterium]|nr:TonB-dependent receptor [Steroidobacteraceae bacterium]
MLSVKRLTGTWLATLVAATASAQEAQKAPAAGSMVVTATRTEKPVYDIPAAIDVVSGEELREHRANVDLSEGVGKIPGLVVNNRYNYAQDLQVSSRGFGARAAFGVRGVRLLQDGIPLTMPDGQGQTALFDLDGANRIEVLRGPFAALYGNSSGGVIHLLSATESKPAQIQANASNTDEGTWRGAMRFSGALGSTDFAGNLSRFDTDGFRDHSAARRDSANLWVRFHPDDVSTLTVLGNWLDQPDTQDPLGLTQAQLDADPTQAGIGAEQFNTRKSISHAQGGLAYDRAFSEQNSVRVLGYYGDRQVEQYLANPSTAISGSGGVVDLDRQFGGGGMQWHHSGTIGNGTYDFTLGADYDHMKERRQGFVNNAGVRGELRRDEDDIVDSFDQYLIASWNPTERWQISGGVRRTDVSFEAEDFFIVPGNPDDSGSRDFKSTQPVLGVLFKVTPAVHLFASAGEGFETPTFSEMAYRPDGLPGLNFDLKPADSTNFEAGAKMQLGQATRLTTTLFHSDTDDDIVTGPAPFPGRNTFVNADRTTREGAELAFSTAALDAALTLDVAYTYTRARFEDFVNFAGLDLSGNQIPGVPENAAYAELNWHHQRSGFTAGLEGRWADKVFVDDINSASADSYVVFNIHAGFRQRVGTWRFEEFLRVDNVADEEYVGSVVVNAVNGRFFEPALPRTYLLGFTASYSPQ